MEKPINYLEIISTLTDEDNMWSDEKIRRLSFRQQNLISSWLLHKGSMIPKSMCNDFTDYYALLKHGYYYQVTRRFNGGKVLEFITSLRSYRNQFRLIGNYFTDELSKSELILIKSCPPSTIGDHMAIVVKGGRVCDIYLPEWLMDIPVQVYDLDVEGNDMGIQNYRKSIAQLQYLISNENYQHKNPYKDGEQK